MQGKTALIIVDAQNDFCAGGSLEVKDAESVFPVINNLRKTIPFNYIYLTCDWHPIDHVSFASQHPGKKPLDSITLPNGLVQELWPDHCVQNQPGADFHKDLVIAPTDIIIRKGCLSSVDSYGGFGCLPEDTGLEKDLKSKGVDRVFVVGIALDFCVKFTAIDAFERGFKTYFVQDAVAIIFKEKQQENLECLASKGIKIIQSADIKNYI